MLGPAEIRQIQKDNAKRCMLFCKWCDPNKLNCLKRSMYIDGDIRIDPCRLFEAKEKAPETKKFRCQIHPRYTGAKKPEGHCDDCWKVFLER